MSTEAPPPAPPLRIGTHSGSFHADEVFAIAALGLARGPLEVVRTRDRERLAGCAMRIDVGRGYDPATGDFDHHQGGVGERPNGIRYASFGLIWREVGEQLTGSAAVAAEVDALLVAPIDAGDNGQELYEPKIDGAVPYAVSGLIAALNPPWDAEDGAAAERAAFDEAVAIAERTLRAEIARATARARAADLVRAALARAEDPRLLELDRGMPWRDVVVAEAPEVLFVVYPRTNDWGLQAVPAAAHGFANRRSLPEPWAGLEGEPLQQVTGVADAVFCHVARFMAVAGSRDGVLALARQALDGPA
ncbi:MYG1 family protein [Patulibacter defluvii]|uniref:MYG1 family protein n=1 Tax=Patulibacter defluvii TaxID=3095358 RepID=UPI002A76528C|nr:MYG1 family protein [Patulibacter sp. DM4]